MPRPFQRLFSLVASRLTSAIAPSRSAADPEAPVKAIPATQRSREASPPNRQTKRVSARGYAAGGSLLVAVGVQAAEPGFASLKSLYKRPDTIPFPTSAPYSPQMATLGKMLFFDPRLSGAQNLSCASCHNPSFGYEVPVPGAIGAANTPLGRKAPTILNAAYTPIFFWDGRAKDLEQQAQGPLTAAAEMNGRFPLAESRLREIPEYKEWFDRLFPNSGVTKDNLLTAIATYERTIVTGWAPFDRWVDGDETAMTDSAKRGFALFNGKAGCAACHKGWNFTDNEFYDVGFPDDVIGRGKLEPTNPMASHAFKTPGLRNLIYRAPFGHAGQSPDLSSIIAFYESGGVDRPSKSALIKRFTLSARETEDLLDFLKSLTADKVETPLPNLPNRRDAPMSIRTKILFPLLALVMFAVSIAASTSWMSHQDQVEIASITGKAIEAGELSRKAHEDFARLGDLVGEVTAMTHFVDAATIRRRFGDGAASIDAELTGLLAASQSPEMTKLARDAAQQFTRWRGEAEGVLGLRPTEDVETLDVLKRDGMALENVRNEALELAGHDARERVAQVGAKAKASTNMLLTFALLFGFAGAVGAFWLAGDLSRPLRALVAGAERLAGGDVEVAFHSLGRTDEIGEISRAVARFRDNVLAAQGAQAAGARDRAAAEEARRHGAALASAVGEEQAKVVEALGAALDRLAAGDLTQRVTEDFGAPHARLKTDFNASLDTLQQAMTGIIGAAGEMLAGSNEISGMSDDLSRRTGEQTASIEEAAAALEEITKTVKLTADGAGRAREIVSRTRAEAEKSGEVVRVAVEAIARTQTSSRGINKIVNVIDEIAFQTNLLALNAGVEAARAGDSGRGFAVVATEVRALAQRSATASREIKTLIAASGAQVDTGDELVTSAGTALDRIFSQVSEIDRVVTGIANGAGEQANGLQGVNSGVSDIDRATKRNTAMVERTAAASGALATRAEDLMRSVGRFRIASEPERARRPHPSASPEPALRRRA